MKVRPNVDYSSKDYDGFRADLIAMLSQKIPEYSDFSSSDAGIVLLELLAHGLDVMSYYNDIVANEVFLATAKDRESVVRLTELIGYSMYNSVASRYVQVFEIIPQDEDFVIPKGFKVKTAGTGSLEEQTFELDGNLTIPAGKTGMETADGEYLYQVTVTHGITVEDELLGSSNGTPEQEFIIGYDSVIEDSLRVYVNEGAGFTEWNKVDKFIDSTASSMDFRYLVDDMNRAKVRFGDGVSGKIPAVVNNGIICDYRVGGGTVGNVAANTITKMDAPLAGILSTTNPYTALVSGVDKETIASAKRNAPLSVRTLERAVTRQDFEDLAMTLSYVQNAKAVESDVQTKVTLYLMIAGHTDLPVATATLIETFFADKMVMGTVLELQPVNWYDIDLIITIKAYPSYANADIKTLVESAVDTYFTQGEFGFGEEYVRSDLSDLLSSIPGVRSVNIDVADTNPGATYAIRLNSRSVTVTEGR